MRRPVFGESILELRWDWPTVGGGPEFPAVVAALGGFFVVGKDGGVGASKRFQTCQRAAIFFGLDLCLVGQGAHVPGELRVEERDRIIAIAATDAEVAYVGGDHFGFRGSKRGKVLHSVLSRESDEVQKLTVSARLFGSA